MSVAPKYILDALHRDRRRVVKELRRAMALPAHTHEDAERRAKAVGRHERALSHIDHLIKEYETHG